MEALTQPTEKWGGQTRWSNQEDELIRTMYPDPMTTLDMIQENMPWRTVKAISTRAARLGVTKIYPEEYM